MFGSAVIAAGTWDEYSSVVLLKIGLEVVGIFGVIAFLLYDIDWLRHAYVYI
jgi:preprotein translocase subunit Sss1